MIWVAVAGIVAVGAVALYIAARAGGTGWWRFVLAGAAGWLAAQVVKSLVVAPLTLLAAGRGGQAASAASALASHWWYIGFAALLPGVVEELGKYFPLRWLRVRARGSALALGVGASAVEALTLVASLGATAGHAHETALGALIAVWERTWGVTFHAASATIDGYAVWSGRARWLIAAMGLHTLLDLGAAWYQHALAVSAPHAVIRAALAVTEVAALVIALLALWLGRRLWARAA